VKNILYFYKYVQNKALNFRAVHYKISQNCMIYTKTFQ